MLAGSGHCCRGVWGGALALWALMAEMANSCYHLGPVEAIADLSQHISGSQEAAEGVGMGQVHDLIVDQGMCLGKGLL